MEAFLQYYPVQELLFLNLTVILKQVAHKVISNYCSIRLPFSSPRHKATDQATICLMLFGSQSGTGCLPVPGVNLVCIQKRTCKRHFSSAQWHGKIWQRTQCYLNVTICPLCSSKVSSITTDAVPYHYLLPPCPVFADLTIHNLHLCRLSFTNVRMHLTVSDIKMVFLVGSVYLQEATAKWKHKWNNWVHLRKSVMEQEGFQF